MKRSLIFTFLCVLVFSALGSSDARAVAPRGEYGYFSTFHEMIGDNASCANNEVLQEIGIYDSKTLAPISSASLTFRVKNDDGTTAGTKSGTGPVVGALCYNPDTQYLSIEANGGGSYYDLMVNVQWTNPGTVVRKKHHRAAVFLTPTTVSTPEYKAIFPVNNAILNQTPEYKIQVNNIPSIYGTGGLSRASVFVQKFNPITMKFGEQVANKTQSLSSNSGTGVKTVSPVGLEDGYYAWGFYAYFDASNKKGGQQVDFVPTTGMNFPSYFTLDTTPPKITTVDQDSNNPIELTTSAIDSLSGISNLRLYVDNGLFADCLFYGAKSGTCTKRTGVQTPGSTHTYYAVAIDVAGNVATSTIKTYTVPEDPIYYTITATPSTINENERTTIEWHTNHSGICMVSNWREDAWWGSNGVKLSSKLPDDRWYTLYCDGWGVANVHVTVIKAPRVPAEPEPPLPPSEPTLPPVVKCPGTVIDNCRVNESFPNTTSGICNAGYINTCSYTCEPDGTWKRNENSCVALTATLSANPPRVNFGGTTRLDWSTNHPGTCLVKSTPNAGTWPWKFATNIQSGPMTAETTFALICDGQTLVSAVVKVDPALDHGSDPIITNPSVCDEFGVCIELTKSLTVDPHDIPSGEKTMVKWDTNHPGSCKVKSTAGEEWPGAHNPGVQSKKLYSDTTYTLYCDGTAIANDTVTINGGTPFVPDCTPSLIGNCTLNSTAPGNTQTGMCAQNFIGTCKYTCDMTGHWTENQNSCVEITSSISAQSPKNFGEKTTVKWNTNHPGVCKVTGTTGDVWNQKSNPAGVLSKELYAPTERFTMVCDGNPVASAEVVVNQKVSISTNVPAQKSGQPVIVSWDTHGNDVGTCTLKGEGLTQQNLIDSAGVGNKTVELSTQTTYTLSCQNGALTDSVTVKLIPLGYET